MATRNKKQVEILLTTLLAKGASVAQAARQADVSERTVYRRRQQPEFQARVAAIQEGMLQRTADVLTKAHEGSVHSLVTLLQDNATPPNVRRSAARDILDLAPRLREEASLEKRLAALENWAAAPSVPANPPGPSLTATNRKRRRGDTIVQAALAGGDTVAQAAGKANLTERTIYRRLQDPSFKRCLDDLRAEMVQRAAALLIAASMLATKTLIDLQHPSVPASVRRRASRDIIELGRILREMTIVEKRLAALEAKQLPLSA